LHGRRGRSRPCPNTSPPQTPLGSERAAAAEAAAEAAEAAARAARMARKAKRARTARRDPRRRKRCRWCRPSCGQETGEYRWGGAREEDTGGEVNGQETEEYRWGGAQEVDTGGEGRAVLADTKRQNTGEEGLGGVGAHLLWSSEV